MIAQDSAKFWLPKLELHPWQWMRDWIPQTAVVNYDEEQITPALMGQQCEAYNDLYYRVQDVIEHAFQTPVFIRTDITSAKHSGVDAFKVSNYDGLNHALLTTLSHAQLKSYHQKIKSSAILIRPWLELAYSRTAFHGLPVAKEWRVFADQLGVQCHHHYWPEAALKGHMDDGGNPDPLHGWIRTDALDAAKQAAKAMGELKWSVDFAEDKSGKIWLLDMATADNSYHVPNCPHVRLDKSDEV